MKNCLYLFVASAFGLGLCPIFPGTFGTLLGVSFHVLIMLYFPLKAQLPALISIFILVCMANHALTPWAEAYWQCNDPGHFVLDEVAGYLLIPILFPYGTLCKSVVWGFVLFRILDITKFLPPTRQIDRNMHGAWGILLDDLVSAGYTVLIMYVVYRVKPEWLT